MTDGQFADPVSSSMPMDEPLKAFRNRLCAEWLSAFVGPRPELSPEGFVKDSIRLSGYDASNFMRAMDSGVVHDLEGGHYRCARSAASEQLFWEGLRTSQPRRLTLWIEPVITIATMGRLHLDYLWPAACLCMQPKSWALDFAAFPSADAPSARIAGEVKKSIRELDRMMAYIKDFAVRGEREQPAGPAPAINAFRKWRALRKDCPPLFWAVGPDNETRLFAMEYIGEDKAALHETDLERLQYRPGDDL
jgi:hypothetical protein